MCDTKKTDMNKLKWMHYYSTLYTAQLQCFENDDSLYDVVLVSSDGKQFKSHKIVLSSSSDFFYTILLDVPMEIVPTVYLPDADSTVLECVLSFVYVGETSVSSAHLPKILDMCKYLQIKGFITHDYSLSEMKVVTSDAVPNEATKDGSEGYKFSAVENVGLSDVIQYISDAQPEDEFAVEYLDCTEIDENFSDVAESEIQIELESTDSSSHLVHVTNDPLNKNDIKMQPKSKRRTSHGQISRSMCNDFDMALSELSKGKTIHQLSIEYNLPRSTLYQKFRSNESLKQNYRSERRYALDQAVRSVMEERLSLKKASDRYNLPKTAIWRELRKCHHYQPPSKEPSQERQNAQNEIMAGKSLTSISNKYGIPLTTLHRDKKRLSSEGKLPEIFRVRDRTENSDYGKRLEQALQKCRQGMSQYQAARIFNIPKATMWRYAHALFKVEVKDNPTSGNETYDANVSTENDSE